MTALRTAGLAAAGFVLASASAFAQAPMTHPDAAAKPALTHTRKVALEKSCQSEWAAERKTGQTRTLHYRTFITDCMKKGA